MNTQTAIQKTAKDDSSLSFIPYGQQDQIKLSVNMIKTMLAVPTRSGKTCSDKDAFKFIMKCQAKRINPFEDDCWLIGYDTKNGPVFSQVVGHQAYLKRAELHPEFDGKQSGVVILWGDTEKEVEGDFVPRDAELLGGWCRVFFKQRKYPEYKKLNLENFIQTYEYEDRKTGQMVQKVSGQWEKNAAGMIVKCAEADALRSAFPTMLGGLFLREELSIPISAAINAPDMAGTSGLVAEMEPPKRIEQAQGDGDNEGDLGPQAGTAAPPPDRLTKTPQDEIMDLVLDEKKTFDDFKAWGVKSQQLAKPDMCDDFASIPTADAKRILRVKNLLVDELRGGKK